MSISVTTRRQKLEREDTATSGAGTGTISATGAAVTGSGSMFLSEVDVNDMILVTVDGEDELRLVIAVASDTGLTLNAGFSADPSGASYTIKKFITVPLIRSITGPTQTANQIDNTTADDEVYQSNTPGLISAPNMSADMLFRPRLSGHQALNTLLTSGVQIYWRKWLADSDDPGTTPPPDGANSFWLVFGAVGEFSPSSPLNDNEQMAFQVFGAGEPQLFIGTGT